MRYKVTTLSPTLVGDGRELAPVDYMVWKDQVNVLDQNRIFKLLARGPRLEGYLTQLRKATKLDFAAWGGFAQNFSLRRIPFENGQSTAIWNSAPTEDLFIPTFTADHRGPYLPGSALKGALRTGLVASRWNTATVDRLAASMEGDRYYRRHTEAAESNAGATQTKILALGDSNPALATGFKVYLTRVASIDTRGPRHQLAWKVADRGSVPAQRVGDSTPLFAEMAVPGTSFTGDADERTFLENQGFTRDLGWRSVPALKTLVDAANDFAGAQLHSHLAFAEGLGLTQLAHSVSRLQGELETARNSPGTCLLCVGWGGGFVSKSAVTDRELASYVTILRSTPAIGRSMRAGVPFPKTRRVVFAGGQPSALPGWVKLDLNQ